jgi:hypothetical protein
MVPRTCPSRPKRRSDETKSRSSKTPSGFAEPSRCSRSLPSMSTRAHRRSPATPSVSPSRKASLPDQPAAVRRLPASLPDNPAAGRRLPARLPRLPSAVHDQKSSLPFIRDASGRFIARLGRLRRVFHHDRRDASMGSFDPPPLFIGILLRGSVLGVALRSFLRLAVLRVTVMPRRRLGSCLCGL